VRRLDFAIRTRALLGDSELCGDLGLGQEENGIYTFVLLDVLGHGKEAHQLALTANDFINRNINEDAVSLIKELHQQLYGSRGLVMAVVKVDAQNEIMWYSGIGNITARTYGMTGKSLVFKDGIIGNGEIWPVLTRNRFQYGDVLILQSDGVKEHFCIEDISLFLIQSPEIIADTIMKRYGTKFDDASCIVVKYLK